MHKVMIALVVAGLAAGPLVASEKTDVMEAVQQAVDAFNKGDTKGLLATCTDQMCIIDEFPPYEWHGAGTCSKWSADYDADAKKNGITDGVVTLGSLRHVDITADRAYVVGPADYTYKQKGKVVKETGSMFTVALQKSVAGWRIVAWAWAKN